MRLAKHLGWIPDGSPHLESATAAERIGGERQREHRDTRQRCTSDLNQADCTTGAFCSAQRISSYLRGQCIQLDLSITDGQEVSVYLTHAGRVHLWNQRDALLRDPDLEPFGLRSRATWDRDLFLRLQWTTKEAPLSLMFLDLDNFGRVNKEYGAPLGDAVLRLVFGLVRNVVGLRGAAYRYGGEEVGGPASRHQAFGGG